MKRIIAMAALAALLAGGWYGWQARKSRVLGSKKGLVAGPVSAETVPCPLWFPPRAGMGLCEEQSTRPKTNDPSLILKGVIDALHRGPSTPCANRIFPEDSSPRAVFLSADGTAYLDYPKSVFERPMGLLDEFLLIRALGKTILRNCPEVRSFVILVDGAPRDFISQHMPAHGKFILPAVTRKK
jgi:hypothetical protein